MDGFIYIVLKNGGGGGMKIGFHKVATRMAAAIKVPDHAPWGGVAAADALVPLPDEEAALGMLALTKAGPHMRFTMLAAST